LIIRHIRLVSARDGMQQIWGYFYYWKVTPLDVNSKPHLNSDEEKICVTLASASIEYHINRMVNENY